MAVQIASHGVASARRSFVSMSPTNNAASSNAIEYLPYSPNVAAAASPSQFRRIAHHTKGPREWLERRRGKHVTEQQIRGRERYCDAGKPLRKTTATELARDLHGDVRRERSGDTWEEAERDQGVVGGLREPRCNCDERRLIYIAPREMTAAGDEVQFVTEVAVAPRRSDMHEKRNEPNCDADHRLQTAMRQDLRVREADPCSQRASTKYADRSRAHRSGVWVRSFLGSTDRRPGASGWRLPRSLRCCCGTVSTPAPPRSAGSRAHPIIRSYCSRLSARRGGLSRGDRIRATIVTKRSAISILPTISYAIRVTRGISQFLHPVTA